MSKTKQTIELFLSQKNIAVVGVSEAVASRPANAIFDKLIHAGYNVFVVNPNLDTYKGQRCYKSLDQISESIGGVMIVTNPGITDTVVDQCLSNGVKHIWIHNMLGTNVKFGTKLTAKITSVSDKAVEKARSRGVNVIPGSCPMQYIEPVDKAHKCIRWFTEMVGNQ